MVRDVNASLVESRARLTEREPEMICRCNRVILPDNGCYNPLFGATVVQAGLWHSWGHCRPATETEQAVTVACPECEATAGEPCSAGNATFLEGARTWTEKLDRQWPHGGRVLRVRYARRDAEGRA
jgi:hypothetical protein